MHLLEIRTSLNTGFIVRLLTFITVIFILTTGASYASTEETAKSGRAAIEQKLPGSIESKRDILAKDIYDFLTGLDIEPSAENINIVVALIGQRGDGYDVETLIGMIEEFNNSFFLKALVKLRLGMTSDNGRTFRERLYDIQTEKDFEGWYNEFIDIEIIKPLVKLFGKDTGGLV
jgi:hypothetical protein